MSRLLRLACALLLGGCATHSLDVGRPLVVAKIPTEGERLVEIRNYFPGVPQDVLAESLRLSRSARNSFDVMQPNDWTSFVPIGRLAKSINLVPDNPFAWVQLGANLALNHKTEAAISATTRGLEIVDQKCAGRECAYDFERLRYTGSINLAIYSADAERPVQALAALRRIPWRDLPAFERLAYHWTSATVRTALGDAGGARASLYEAGRIETDDVENSGSSVREDYPQYFDDDREAMELYLAAVADLADDECLERQTLAEMKARAAIEHDHHLWDAHLLLANIQYARGQFDDAIGTLTRLESAKDGAREFFRPERIAYNLGGAYLARFDRTHDPEDLQNAEKALRRAATIVETRFNREDARARLSGAFDHVHVARFFLDALSTTSPFYADACNNLGTVFARRADQAKNVRERNYWLTEAEGQWLLALRDHSWPRRHLAYGNLARHYAKLGRLSAAAAAADAALDADPFNVVPLLGLLDLLGQQPGPDALVAAHIAGRLIGQRRSEYPIGTFDEFLQPYEDRLRSLPPDDEALRALFALEYARASDDEVEAILRRAWAEFPQWLWPRIEIARRDIAKGRAIEEAWAMIEPLANRKIPSRDWLAHREQGDVYLLRAELRAHEGRSHVGEQTNRKYIEARRDIERAVAAGVEAREIAGLVAEVHKALADRGQPRVASFAVAPFDTIHTSEKRRIGHSLAASLSTIFRGARSGLVRFLERDALDVADWSPRSAVEVARAGGIGAVLAGRYATSRQRTVIDVRVLDSVTGEVLFTKAYPIERHELLKTQSEIANDVLAALRLTPVTPVEKVAETAFSTRHDAYEPYLAGMNVLLSEPRADRRNLEHARDWLETAAKRDKSFARAYAGIAFASFGLANLHLPSRKVMPKAEEAAEKAIALAPAAPEPQLAMALVRTWYSWNLETGGAAFEKAVELGGSNSTIHRLYGDFLLVRGRPGDLDAALDQKREALALSPQSAVATLDVGWAHFFRGEFDDALAHADAALTLHSKFAQPYVLKSWVYTKTGRFDDALEALDQADKRWKGPHPPPLHRSHRAVTLFLSGDTVGGEEALNDLRRSEQWWADFYVLPLFEARVLAAKGDKGHALNKLSETFDDGSESMMWLPIDPWFDSLRDDPEFRKLIENVRKGR